MRSSLNENSRFSLSASALTGGRGDQILFRNLSFDLPPGTGLRIAGPNGSGKTTLLRMLAGLSKPFDGEARLSPEINPTEGELSLREHRARVMYLGHNLGLNLRLNAVENLCFWLDLQRDISGVIDSSAREREEACRLALEEVGLFEQQLLACSELSAGQKRRASLARVFLADKFIQRKCLWVMDEPLTSLDRSFSQVLIARAAEHVAGGGLLLMTTHQNPEGISLKELQLGDFV